MSSKIILFYCGVALAILIALLIAIQPSIDKYNFDRNSNELRQTLLSKMAVEYNWEIRPNAKAIQRGPIVIYLDHFESVIFVNGTCVDEKLNPYDHTKVLNRAHLVYKNLKGEQ